MVLRVKDLTKRYGEFLAVDGLSFELKKGEILGLLGPNGAGKTTTIQMLLGLTLPTSGHISYFGKDFSKEQEYCLSRINFASSYAQVQSKMTVWQNLRIYAGLYSVRHPKKRIAQVSELLKLDAHLGQEYFELSSGQKTRVHLAKALLNKPSLILMDEPTASLDPEIRNEVLELIRQLQEEQEVSILYTSHDMDEVSRICDRVMFLSHGKLLAVDTPLALTKMVGDTRLRLTFDGDKSVVEKYLEEKKFEHSFKRRHVVEIRLPEKDIPKAMFGLSKRDIWLTNIDIIKPNLEDVFLHIAKNEHE